jgi:hypothetical protein
MISAVTLAHVQRAIILTGLRLIPRHAEPGGAPGLDDGV